MQRKPMNCRHFKEYEVCRVCDTPIYKSDVCAVLRIMYGVCKCALMAALVVLLCIVATRLKVYGIGGVI